MVSVAVAIHAATYYAKEDGEDERGTADDGCEDKWSHVSDGMWMRTAAMKLFAARVLGMVLIAVLWEVRRW